MLRCALRWKVAMLRVTYDDDADERWRLMKEMALLRHCCHITHATLKGYIAAAIHILRRMTLTARG